MGADAAGAASKADVFIKSVLDGDWRALLDLGARDFPAACGYGCIAAFLASSLAVGCRARLLGRHDSSTLRQSREEWLVEYAAMAFIEEGR
jgi:AmmeMemoRadiSam system protein B